jgi:hypothetical protein
MDSKTECDGQSRLSVIDSKQYGGIDFHAIIERV